MILIVIMVYSVVTICWVLPGYGCFVVLDVVSVL